MEHNFHDFHCGEVYYADLNPVFGHEQGGTRPVLVLQNDVVTFVDRIEIGPKVYEDGSHRIPARVNQPYRQSVRIFYKFIGEVQPDSREEQVDVPAS